MNYLKEIVCTGIGILGSLFTNLLGGWSPTLTALLIAMLADLITGVIVAVVFKQSPKTETGAAESMTMFKGLCRKFAMIILVAVAHQLDIVLDMSYIMTACVYAFLANEVLSIVENAGLMGIVKSQILIEAIDILKKKAGDKNEK